MSTTTDGPLFWRHDVRLEPLDVHVMWSALGTYIEEMEGHREDSAGDRHHWWDEAENDKLARARALQDALGPIGQGVIRGV